MIRDQSCLNMIAIESRMQGDHEELDILLQKNVKNFFTFLSKIKFKERRTLMGCVERGTRERER